MARLRITAALLLGAAAFGLAACGSGQFPQTTLHPAADLGLEIDQLFRLIVWLAAGVFVVVEGLLLYTVFKFRARPGQPAPRRVHGHTLLEIAWTLAPAVILVFIAVPTIQTIFRTASSPPTNAVPVDVIGHQWWWEFRYPGLDVVTANEMHVPRGRPVALAITSADVIHSFWIPRLAAKRDAILGRTNRIFFTPDSTGVYRGQCAEFCGESHANMGLRVVVDDSTAFATWVTDQQRAPVVDSTTALVRQGAEEFRRIRNPSANSCIVCHTIQGVSAGATGPNLSHVGSRVSIAAGTLANSPEGLSTWLRNPPAVKPGSKMPNIGLTDQEITALVAYLQSLR